jgi:hypothetical protein
VSKTNRILAICLFWFCVPPVFAQSTASEEAASRAAMLEFLGRAVAGTPYSALVVHTKVKVVPIPDRSTKSKKAIAEEPGVAEDPGEERHVYYARVLETFKGKAYATIRYEMVVEKGEETSLNPKPQVLTLCKERGNFYWPGVGASFPGDDAEVISVARRVAKQPVKRGAAPKSQCD